MRMAQRVHREIVTLPNYGVFDDLSFSIKGYTVALKGFASRPTLKSDAERVVKRIEGVEQVVNNIEVLALSNFDDGITNDPPPGWRPIHIIVRSGNVTLTGVVDNEADKAIANVQANSVSGVFAVDDQLQAASSRKPKKSRKPKS
ncbi:MAG: BON domain-containing protein [Acidobacteria bacterium]|nr:BON domain-containing protein [Acidobacteriota bacterium]